MMPAMRTMPAATLEASTAAITATIRAAIATTVTVAAAMGTIGTPIRASAASAESAAITTTITAAVASTALRALEAGTRIGADAGEIFSRSVRITRAAGFSRQKNSVVFNDGFNG